MAITLQFAARYYFDTLPLPPGPGGVHYLPGSLRTLRTRAASAPRGPSCPCSLSSARGAGSGGGRDCSSPSVLERSFPDRDVGPERTSVEGGLWR
jgi:hypothetical protein